MRNYYIELDAYGYKTDKNGVSYENRCFEKACAFFSTAEKVGTRGFLKVMTLAINETGQQKVDNGWQNYTIGLLFIQDGVEAVSPNCPSYGEGHRHVETWKEYRRDEWKTGVPPHYTTAFYGAGL